jgi:hypothetical protein
MKCDKCGRKLLKVDRRVELAEPDEDATDGQMADYYAAEMSGDMGNWGVAILDYWCESCEINYSQISDTLKSYDELIVRWHEKAEGGDYFSRYIFEYLAFTAYLKGKLIVDARSDRNAIQRLKRDAMKGRAYLLKIERASGLKKFWNQLIDELKEEPLHNSSRDYDNPEMDEWWNNVGDQIADGVKGQKGIVHSVQDWPNMVEFWYAIRNNLFHGGKDPDVQRDIFLVEHAYRTLKEFMKLEIGSHSQIE